MIDYSKNDNFYALLPLTHAVINDFIDSKFNRIKLIYNKFKTTVKYDAQL